MKQINLTIGLNDKNTLKQEISEEAARFLIEYTCFQYELDVTIIPVRGVYKMHSNGKQVIENSFRCEFYGADKKTVIAAAKEICKDLNQESIAYSEIEIESEFITA